MQIPDLQLEIRNRLITSEKACVKAGRKVPKEQRHICLQKWLADNCFGDYYTRNGLSDREREMITFCYIMAQGESLQTTADGTCHGTLGNDKQFLIEVVSQCVPYIGYPRSLNVLSCVNKSGKLNRWENNSI